MSSSLLIEKDLSSSQHYTRTAKEIYFPNDLFVFIFLHKSFDTTLFNKAEAHNVLCVCGSAVGIWMNPKDECKHRVV